MGVGVFLGFERARAGCGGVDARFGREIFSIKVVLIVYEGSHLDITACVADHEANCCAGT